MKHTAARPLHPQPSPQRLGGDNLPRRVVHIESTWGDATARLQGSESRQSPCQSWHLKRGAFTNDLLGRLGAVEGGMSVGENGRHNRDSTRRSFEHLMLERRLHQAAYDLQLPDTELCNNKQT